ncbi:AAA family ATPase [Nakamurella deserti]|uniref:AAA family ATPase n=1 Tax=Nakamurella deserti TaxID=2164074 RepID=UPI000DBE0237|nr:AAA family ATPase [Nakamurella deserti]
MDTLTGTRAAPGESVGDRRAAPVVLTEKLRRPETTGLGRPRLEAPLVDGVPGSRLSLVVGPPGSGKTTLLARVCALAPVPTAWYRMTSDDTSEATMLAHLARSLGTALGRSLAAGGTAALLADLEQGCPPALLVLDDVHEIVGSPAERGLERFVALRPENLRVLAGSRRQPDLSTLRLRLWGQLHEISGDDLRFRSWEVEDLFRNVFRRPLTPEAAAALTRRIGGWAAGLQLFHLATRGHTGPDRQRAVGELGGRSRLIRSYLVRNVIGELPEDRRQFLMKTSTLGTLTGDLCDRLLDTTGSATILDDLAQQQLFTSSEDDGRTFRYHEVLRAHLEWALQEEYGAERARSFYAASAALLEGAGMTSAAVRAHARAENWGAVAALVRSRGSDPVVTATGTDLVLPPAVVQFDPWLSLTEARRRMRAGAVTAAVTAFEQAESLLDEPDFRDSCRRERGLALLWTAVPADPRTLPDHWSAVVRIATRRPVDPAGGATWSPDDDGARLGAALVRLLAGDLAGAATLLGPLADAPDPTHRLLGRLAATVPAGWAADRSADTAAEFGRIALEAEFAGLPWVERMSRGLAEAALVAGRAPDWRIEACDDVLEECERAGDAWGAAVLRTALAVALRDLDADRSAAAFTDARGRFERLDAPVPAGWCDVLARSAARGGGGLAGDDGAHPGRAPGAAAVPTAPRRPAGVGDGPPAEPGAGPPRVAVRCLGGFDLEISGRAVDLAALRPRARAVLRMLALAGGRYIHQERLVDAFWPGADYPVGLRRLQVALSSVRHVLEPHGPPGLDWLPRRDSGYRLAMGPGSRLDVRRFEEHLTAARAAAGDPDATVRTVARQCALELYRGDLLPEDGAAEHLTAERDRLRVAAAEAAAALAVDLRASGRRTEALAAAGRSIGLEPLQDAAWRQLAALHEEAGDATAALRVRLQHARIIAELVPAGG